ncbi:uncharacterized protein Z519_00451 [Cladophialophora bantiana CBS 173.52]|uniref:Zn(2)-C6 fungal-type domain-containing protein n=1 Tax=Cladophialophora bantiana (strain ATCC 10958 / CBS 173.52 / CDC B-1940 / NIH 8579) TaxID=1442370 RepID=A0A0D2HZ88_CLAB1|nr:uncharacterized protein Z519_00451 [Cladophialophora bantiana CBS 173.52]KIW98788.1 hypothetical protein Z519_00451 [Cladophialophora bantiana CBS 173.52]
MGRNRRQTGHLQGTFPPPRIVPSQGPGQHSLYSSQPQYNEPPQPPPFSTSAQQPNWQPGQHPRGYGLMLAAEPNTPSTTDAASPVSTRSTLSRSSVATSTNTSYTAALEYARQFSPDVDTPPSPSASVSTVHPPHPADHASDQSLHQTIFGSDYVLGANHAMTEGLLGIDTPAPLAETSRYLFPSPQFLSPQNPSPGPYPRFPGRTDPWNTFPFRHENQYVNMGTSSPVPTVQADCRSLSSRERGGGGGGGRTGPLNPTQRQQASDVRRRGACLRCAVMREKCDLGNPCNNCLTKERRKCPKYCIPNRSDWDGCKTSLFPDELTCRLRKDNLLQYLANSTFDVSHRPFQIPLDMYIGIPLYVLVREFHPLQPALEIRHAFQTSHGPNGEKSYDRQQTWNPPIIMCIRNGELEKTVNQVRKNITGIFDKLLADPKEYRKWTTEYFEEQEEDFQTQILRVLGRYYRRDIEEHSILKAALRLLWFEYLLLNKFTVPAEAVPILEANLGSKRPVGAPQHLHVIPDTINRFLKAIILPLAEKAAEKLIKNLHDMMFKMAVTQKMPQGRRDLVLCLLFILVIFLGRTQVALLFLSHTPAPEIGMEYSQEQAESKIEEMEQIVSDYLLSFHRYTLSRMSSRSPVTASEYDSPSERHAREFDLVDRLRKEIGGYACERPERLEPGDYQMDTFRYMNVRRLCWKVIGNLNWGSNY